jgi:formamidopyrimidine-DNA glycosylase
MPEAPDLEVIKEFLDHRVIGSVIESCKVLRPTVVRSLAGEITTDLPGHTLNKIERRGKFLTISFSGQRSLVINPMLTGALQYCPPAPAQRVQKKTCLVLGLAGGQDLRYLVDRQMGKVYYISDGQEGDVPQYTELGPDVLSDISLEEFTERLKKFHGEIKGVLTRGSLVSGIGNAYSDEILFAAGIFPFRKTRSLKPQEVDELHRQCRQVLEDAIAVLRERMGDAIHHKIRDFLKVHNKGGQPCPVCGNNITQLTANQRITSYCRHCQPGMLIRN